MQPDYAEALSNRGVTLRELKRFEEALASYDRALKMRPDFAKALSNRGTTLHELKRFEEALASYDRALKVQPDYAEALSNRGVALHELTRFEEALASFDRALKVRPDFADAHTMRHSAACSSVTLIAAGKNANGDGNPSRRLTKSGISHSRCGSGLMRSRARPSSSIASKDLAI